MNIMPNSVSSQRQPSIPVLRASEFIFVPESKLLYCCDPKRRLDLEAPPRVILRQVSVCKGNKLGSEPHWSQRLTPGKNHTGIKLCARKFQPLFFTVRDVANSDNINVNV